MRDFFGNYRDPMWDKMDEIKENMEVMKNGMPDMEKKIADLEAELALEKRKTQAYLLYKAADTEATVSNLQNLIPLARVRFSHSTMTITETYPTSFKFRIGCPWLQISGSKAEWIC